MSEHDPRSPAAQPPRSPRVAKPEWLKVALAGGEGLGEVRRRVSARGLATVCDEARCPNRAECFGRGTATIMVLGAVCTRGCRFCSVQGGHPAPPDPAEPAQVAAAARDLGLRYLVLTMVTRDDLPDGGAAHLAACVAALRELDPRPGVELLGSDFGGQPEALALVATCGADVLAHNLEVVRRLTPSVRDRRAGYERSLEALRLLRSLAPASTPTKSSLLLGLGETEAEVLQALADLRAVGVAHLTLGQYLQPSAKALPVVEYLEPARFDAYAAAARDLGFLSVFAGPLVRSSYRAEEQAAAALPAAGGPGGRP